MSMRNMKMRFFAVFAERKRASKGTIRCPFQAGGRAAAVPNYSNASFSASVPASTNLPSTMTGITSFSFVTTDNSPSSS